LNKKSKKRLYIGIFLVFAILNGVVGYYLFYEKKKSFIFNQLQELSSQYKTVTSEISKKSDIYYDEVANKEDVLNLFKDIDDRSKHPEIREKLIDLLAKPFKRMREKNVRQFHFHTKDSRSFLRMHKQDKYGDSLRGIRHSVVYTNKTLRDIHGFEEGRVNNGFRNVYPVFHQGSHLGSVEISFSFREVSETLQKIYNKYYTFMISKQLVEKKVFVAQDNYIESSLSQDFYAEVGHINNMILNHRDEFQIVEEINKKISQSVSMKLANREKFSKLISLRGETYVVNFFPIKNIEGHSVAYIISYSKAKIIDNEFKQFLIYTVIGTVVIFLFIYMMISGVRKEEFDFINRILDNQNSLIVVKNEDEVIKVNKRFLEFFGYESLEEMKDLNDCLCDYFVSEEGYLSKGFADNNNYLIEYVLNNTGLQHKVKIVDHSTKMLRVFTVSVTKLEDQGLYILMLSDVTSSELEKREIEDRASRDKLTNLYNRTKFDHDIKNAVMKNQTFSMIICDIDKFKVINDTYGHLTGDKILIDFANIIDMRIRKTDIVYRWGGEEFVIMVDDKMISATKLAEKLRLTVQKHRFFKEIPVTASFGVTEHRKFEGVEDIMLRVDKALYTAKLSGRNRVITS
jgi:diguanylate cyclase (GGDEF)-like protein